MYYLSDFQRDLLARAATDTAIARYTNDVETLALTLWGEGRGEDLTGRVAIAWTAMNRVGAKGGTVQDRCLQRLQYSTWWPEGGVDNFRATMDLAQRAIAGTADDPIYRECKYLASGVLGRWFRDPTKGATHYVTKALFYSSVRPTWIPRDAEGVAIGRHVFLGGIAW